MTSTEIQKAQSNSERITESILTTLGGSLFLAGSFPLIAHGPIYLVYALTGMLAGAVILINGAHIDSKAGSRVLGIIAVFMTFVAFVALKVFAPFYFGSISPFTNNELLDPIILGFVLALTGCASKLAHGL